MRRLSAKEALPFREVLRQLTVMLPARTSSRPASQPFRTAFAVVAAVIVGCGPTTDRLPISGQVRLDGAPIDRGTIRFSSPTDPNALAAGGMVRDGEFDIPRERGLPPGEYRLSISSPDRDGPKVPFSPGPGKPTIMVTRDRIPVSYNVESERTVVLEAAKKNVFEFDIASSD